MATRDDLSALVLPLRVLAGLALLALLYAGKPVLLPLAFALLLSLALRPLVRAGKRMFIPPPASAAMIVLATCAGFGFGLWQLAEPAGNWLSDVPQALQALQRQSASLRGPVEDARAATEALQALSEEARPPATRVVMEENRVGENVAIVTGALLAQCTTTFIALFFILGWGDRLFRHAVILVPGFSGRRVVLETTQAIEDAIARYLLTISAINACLGTAVALTAYAQGLPNPILWGAFAGLLNFAPYVGPVLTTVVLFAVSLVSNEVTNPLTAPAMFIVLTCIEGYLLTPYLVGQSLLLNPLVVFVSLLLCFSVWGVVGALVAVPLLVSTKVVLEGMGNRGHPAANVLG